MPRGREVPLQVDGDHRVPLLLRHVHDHPVAEDAGVVDEDVDPAEVVDRLPTSCAAPTKSATFAPFASARPPFASISATTCCAGEVVALAGQRAAEVVDDDVRARLGEGQRVRPADAAPGAGDDRDLAREHSACVENTHVDLDLTPSSS